MYYRRKILLSLFEVMGDELDKIRLQKLLLLLSKKQDTPSFDFIPYKYGGFSFRANADLVTMTKYKQVAEKEKSWVRIEEKKYFRELKRIDQILLQNLADDFRNFSANDLIDYTYKHYPYYAINSSILEAVLQNTDLQKVKDVKPNTSSTELFTIGYEGISLETYLNKLIKNDVKVLIDVRKNSRSMKYGFNKNQLKNACKGVHIAYYHFPDLGIESSKRKKLYTQSDYDTLFLEYSKSTLPDTYERQKEVIELIKTHKRVALTCFEADICQCHRKPLAESIAGIPKHSLKLTHI